MDIAVGTDLSRGVAAAIGFMCVWSGFFVVSRMGAMTALTAFDITALRFMVAGTLVLPFLFRWWPTHLPIRVQLTLSLTGPGAIYSILMYLGLSFATVTYAGVFANGAMPVITLALAFAATGRSPGRQQTAAVALLVLGAVLIGLPGMIGDTGGQAAGIPLFLAASMVLAIYVDHLKRWSLTPKQALAVVTLPNAVVFLPVWFFFLPSGLAQASTADILTQALFQGLGPGFLAVILFAMSARYLGSTPTAGFSAAVPATATLLAIPLLGEIPTPLEWAGLAVVTLGLTLLILKRPQTT